MSPMVPPRPTSSSTRSVPSPSAIETRRRPWLTRYTSSPGSPSANSRSPLRSCTHSSCAAMSASTSRSSGPNTSVSRCASWVPRIRGTMRRRNSLSASGCRSASRSKSSRDTRARSASSTANTVAVRGWPVRSAISPTRLPGPTSSTSVDVPFACSARMPSRPRRTRYTSRSGSPWRSSVAPRASGVWRSTPRRSAKAAAVNGSLKRFSISSASSSGVSGALCMLARFGRKNGSGWEDECGAIARG